MRLFSYLGRIGKCGGASRHDFLSIFVVGISCLLCFAANCLSPPAKRTANRGRSRWWYTRFPPLAVRARGPCVPPASRFSPGLSGNKSLARPERFAGGGDPHIRRGKPQGKRTYGTHPARCAPRGRVKSL